MVVVASDHGGFKLKKIICKYLEEKNIEYDDLGTFNEDRTDYPIYAEKLAKEIQNKRAEKGILICKSGHGMNIAANKFRGIYASLCYSIESVKKAVEDDNINVCVFSSDDMQKENVKEIIDIFLEKSIKDGRYVDRFEMVKKFESENFKDEEKEEKYLSEIKKLKNINAKTFVLTLIFSVIITMLFMIFLPKAIYKFKMQKQNKNENVTKYEKIEDDDLIKLEKNIKELEEILNYSFLDKKNMNKQKMLEGAIKGYIAGLEDPYTNYLTSKEFKEFLNDLDGKFVGIGVAMQKTEKGIEFVTVFDETPAKNVGIKEGDVLLKVEGKDVSDMKLDDIVNLVKGKEGTKVKITIIRNGENKDFAIERKPVKIKYAKGKMLDNEVGYIKLDQFGDEAYKMFREEYEKLEKAGMKKLIFDLRNNTGGELENAKAIIDMFLPENKVMFSTRNLDNIKLDVKSRTKEAKDIKIIILGNKFSASASELLIGALVDNGKAKFIGEKTYGKGVIQEMKHLKNGDYLKITIQEYLRPSGDTINKKGINPNIEQELNIEKYQKEKVDTQLNKALEIIKND